VSLCIFLINQHSSRKNALLPSLNCDRSPMPKEGWIDTPSRRSESKWGRRWLVVSTTTLQVFHTPGKGGRTTYSLPDIATAAAGSDPQHPFLITITFTTGDSLVFAVDSSTEHHEWLDLFNSASSSPPKHKPTLEDFTVIRLLGRGETGRIFLVRSKLDGQLYAMKSISKQQLAEADAIEQSISERNLLFANKSPFLVSAKCSFQSADRIFLVMDYVPGGELFTRLREEGSFDEDRTRLYAAEIALGIGSLHAGNCIYRDLRPENIMVDANGHLKLTDFGIAKQNVGSGQTTQTFCGTPEYIAPEVLQQQPYGKDVDWWSFGILVYEMLVGEPPFIDDNISTMYQNILTAPIDFPEGKVSDVAQNFLNLLLDRNPSTRLGTGPGDVEAVKAHPFFQGLDWRAVEQLTVVPQWAPTLLSEVDTSNFDADITSEAAILLLDDGAGVEPEVQRLFGGFSFAGDLL
jgi:serine/threonine protein kinase